MARSLALPLLLVLSVVLTAQASRFSGAPGPNPAGQRAEALLAFDHLVKEGQALLVESARGVAETKDVDLDKDCLVTLDRNLRRYMAQLATLAPHTNFADARDGLTNMLSVPSDTGVACSIEAYHTKPIVDKIYRFEDDLQATLDEMIKA